MPLSIAIIGCVVGIIFMLAALNKHPIQFGSLMVSLPGVITRITVGLLGLMLLIIGVSILSELAAPVLVTSVAVDSTSISVTRLPVPPTIYPRTPMSAASQFSPAGIYDCAEYEFGEGYGGAVIRLNADGSSTYTSTIRNVEEIGTWNYTPPTELQFTHFRWMTATLDLPNRFDAHRWVSLGPDQQSTPSGFEVRIECHKRP